ncbi:MULTISPECIES: hypothetical protein [unclassified Moorena]|nr:MULTISPECIES: hypothetical protein [unclassified Moorena]
MEKESTLGRWISTHGRGTNVNGSHDEEPDEGKPSRPVLLA